MKLRMHDIRLPMRHPFTISLGTTTVQHNLLVELEEGGFRGYGEGASSHAWSQYTPESMRAALEAARPHIEGPGFLNSGGAVGRVRPVLEHNPFALCASTRRLTTCGESSRARRCGSCGALS